MFSKCAESLEDGKRLENLSWRIWNRETFCCDSLPEVHQTTSLAITSRPRKTDVPDLSASVDSLASDDYDESDTPEQSLPPSKTAPLEIQPAPLRQDATPVATSRGKEKHITPLRFERMIESIQEKQDIAPLSPTIVDAVPEIMPSTDITPRPKSPTLHALIRSSHSSTSTAPLSSPESDRSTAQTVGSDTSAELVTSHSIIRGFSPHQTSSSYRSHTHLAPAAPVPAKSIPHTKTNEPKGNGFLLGCSSGEDESSFEERMPSQTKQSSLTAGLKRPVGAKKQTSFKEELASRLVNNKSHEDEEVFASDDEDSSAIEDESEDEDDDEDDDEEWEDDDPDGADNGISDKPLFQRVDSKPSLVSHRSLLTSLMHEGDRQNAFASMAQSQSALRKSKTQGHMDPSIRFSDADTDGLSFNGPNMKRSKPVLMTSSNSQTAPIAFSPRTTRRHMLATEMTESLRKAVLYERQQKKATAHAILKRRHTTQDFTNIKGYPVAGSDDASNDNHSWNDDYASGGTHDYNQSGW